MRALLCIPQKGSLLENVWVIGGPIIYDFSYVFMKVAGDGVILSLPHERHDPPILKSKLMNRGVIELAV